MIAPLALALALAAAPERASAVSVEPETGAQLPEAARVETLDGPLVLGDLQGERPIAIAPVYFTCPTVCGLTEVQLARAFHEAGLSPGEDAQLLFLSFDPRDGAETAEAARERIAAASGSEASAAIRIGWGGEAEAVLDALGYQRFFDPQAAEFAHPAALAVLTPDGRVSRWLGPEGLTGDQLRRAIVEASNGGMGGVIERALLLCWRFDPTTGKYTPRVVLILQVLGALTVIALAGFILTHLRPR
ncbi:SCO family protein [Marinicauda algicola]|uniref:SCO family protein n=1 Tax=Marinicauda algicola TaxID=2029849 RepID=A0A4S2H5D6_9PROT|nr:SCO family protein [Marinicauda algicola]TGY90621.1 SCO family protein [Marinicauda algicola]